MTSVRPPSGAPTGALGVLGFTDEQEDLYRQVLRSSGADLPALAALLGLSQGDLQVALARLAADGLVEVRDGTVLALPPEQAVTRLIREEAGRLQTRTEDLAAVRGLLPSLHAEHLRSTAPQGEAVTIELVVGGDVVQLIRSLAAATSGDLLWLRPEQWKLPAALEVDRWVQELTRNGRRSRAIYPARILEEAPQVIRTRAEAGEHVRILAEVPFRLAVMGSSAAMLTEDLHTPGDRRLVLRQPALIGALTLLFEGLWERAMPVPGLDGQRYDERASDQRLLLGQLAGGAKDEQIARALGISVRTVRRRVADLIDELGVGSRFQAGVEAVRRGWI